MRLPPRLSRLPLLSLAALAIVSAALAAFSWRGVTFFSFQTRDLDRAAQVAKGALIFWGPEATGGGNLPGGLYYWFLAIPLAFGLGWKGAWYAIALSWATGRIAIYSALRKLISAPAALVGFVLFLPTPILSNFLNVSVAPFFAVLAVTGLCFAFGAALPRTRRAAWALACFAVGAGIQMHFAVIILLFSGLVLQALAPALRLKRLPAKSFGLGLGAFLVPLLPYLVWAGAERLGLRYGEPAPAYSGVAADAIPSLLTLAQGFRETLDALEVLSKIVFLVPLPVVLALGLSRIDSAARGERPRTRARLLRILLVCAAVSLVPASYFFLRPNGLRYTVSFTTVMIGLCALAHAAATVTRRRALAYTVACLCLSAPFAWAVREEMDSTFLLRTLGPVVAAGLLALPLSRRRWEVPAVIAASLLVSFQASYAKSARGIPKLYVPTVRQLTVLANRVHGRTGWTYEEARHRLFFVDGQMELTPKAVYESVVESREREGIVSVRDFGEQREPDGFLVTTALPEEEIRVQGNFFADWILRQPLQGDLARGIREGAIRVGRPYRDGLLTMAPYYVIDTLRYPSSFHNIGYPYETYAGDAVLAGLKDPVGARKLRTDQVLFYWNDCPDPWCTTGALVSFRHEHGQLHLETRILGAPLEQTSEWTGPGWGQAWIAPYLVARCGREQRTVPLLDSVGINHRTVTKISGMPQYYNSFLAPIDRAARIDCPGPLTELRMGREATVIYRMTGLETLPASEASFRIQR